MIILVYLNQQCHTNYQFTSYTIDIDYRIKKKHSDTLLRQFWDHGGSCKSEWEKISE